MALHPPHEREQLSAIEIELATAKKYIRDDLKAKFGYEKNKFFYLDLFEYRINNKLEDIAEDLDVKSLYGIKKNEVARDSVGRAFRGHHNEDFKPEYQFEGLFSEEMNDMIEKIRKSKGGLIGGLIGGQATIETHGDQMRNGGLIGGLIGGRATVETHGDQMRNGGLIGGLIGGRKVADMINPETGVRYVVEASRKANEAQGNHMWSLEEIADIGELKYGEGLTWNDTTSNMNEKYDKNWSTNQVKKAYHNNKDLLADEEE